MVICMDIMLERIMSLMGNRHGSAQELVQALGLSKNTVTEWKSGRSKSYTKHASAIAAYYGVSLDWLSGASDDRTIKKDAPGVIGASYEKEAVISEIISLLERLPPEKLVEEMYYLRRLADDRGLL